jgi:hypothetical protein
LPRRFSRKVNTAAGDTGGSSPKVTIQWTRILFQVINSNVIHAEDGRNVSAANIYPLYLISHLERMTWCVSVCCMPVVVPAELVILWRYIAIKEGRKIIYHLVTIFWMGIFGCVFPVAWFVLALHVVMDTKPMAR